MIKNRVAVLMAEKQIDQIDIYRITDISRKTLYNIMHNKTKGIEFETLDKLCFALDCTPNDLFNYSPNDLSDK